jgi:hypothetical protein
MQQNLFSARRSFAAELPGVAALVQHLTKYSKCDQLLVLGDIESDFEAAVTRNPLIRVHKLFLGTTDVQSALDRITERSILVVRSIDEAVTRSTAFRTLVTLCKYTILVEAFTSAQSERERQSGNPSMLASRLLFSGVAACADGRPELLSIFGNSRLPESVPGSFRVAAIIAVYNEVDIIPYVLDHLFSQEVEVYVMDNWSTDGTFELVEMEFGDQLLGLEKFPLGAPSSTFDLRELLLRKEKLASSLNASWIIHQDADEFRYSPFPNLSLRCGLYIVDQSGYSAVNHTVIEFPPTGEAAQLSGSPETHLTRFRFGLQPSDLVQVKAWKKTGVPIRLADSAGHQVEFDGREIYPYNFLLKHYPIRSQVQGLRKVFSERLPRYSLPGKERGWHVHYTKLNENHNFSEPDNGLETFNSDDFNSRFLVQRLIGCGLGKLEKYVGQRP